MRRLLCPTWSRHTRGEDHLMGCTFRKTQTLKADLEEDRLCALGTAALRRPLWRSCELWRKWLLALGKRQREMGTLSCSPSRGELGQNMPGGPSMCPRDPSVSPFLPIFAESFHPTHTLRASGAPGSETGLKYCSKWGSALYTFANVPENTVPSWQD